METRRVKLLVGLLEGAVLSPALFSFASSGLLRPYARGVGVRLGRRSVCSLLVAARDLGSASDCG